MSNCLVQGGTAQVRFQPNAGQYLAAAAENVVSIFDIETHGKKYTLQVLFLNTSISSLSFVQKVPLLHFPSLEPCTCTSQSPRHTVGITALKYILFLCFVVVKLLSFFYDVKLKYWICNLRDITPMCSQCAGTTAGNILPPSVRT